MRRKLKTKAGKSAYGQRKAIVDRVFGQIKKAVLSFANSRVADSRTSSTNGISIPRLTTDGPIEAGDKPQGNPSQGSLPTLSSIQSYQSNALPTPPACRAGGSGVPGMFNNLEVKVHSQSDDDEV